MFKPMLASNVTDFSKLKFPAMVSPKLDGIRATVQGGQLLSRSLKPIPNVIAQGIFKGLPEGVDGELIVGEPNDDPYLRTTSVVMSSNKPAVGIKLYVFDLFGPDGFESRFRKAESLLRGSERVKMVPHLTVCDVHDLVEAENAFLNAGYEGLMFRDPKGIYKNGRSSEREGILLKVKRFVDAEAIIDGTYEEQENMNEAFTNELGRTARSSAKAGKVGKGRLGGFHVTGLAGQPYADIKFDVASGAIPHATREELWSVRDSLVGKIVTYKFFPTGGDTRPRHPIFKGLRDARDMS